LAGFAGFRASGGRTNRRGGLDAHGTTPSSAVERLPVPARPLVLALGLLLCLAGSIVCATAPANDPQAFPSLSDGLVIVGGVLAIFGVAGRDARGRQLLGRHRPSPPARPVDGERSDGDS
jgi:peptidoglycan/LPS O-acetylase OafA/YrhL